jgi:serine/threonine-protein kinase RsbW
MEICVTFALPRDALSVPVTRQILTGSLRTLGVLDETISDIQVALAEACTNVLRHAHGDAEYEVTCGIRGTLCVIDVSDRGVAGFDASDRGHGDAVVTAEDGRGIQLMRALVDKVRFDSVTGDGTVVHLEKQLTWGEGAALSLLDHVPGSHAGRPGSLAT